MNQIVVGMGEALWDCLPEGKKIGGAPANFAYHVSQFGFDSRVVSAVRRKEGILQTVFAHVDRQLYRQLPHQQEKSIS
jgi:sugar/nucleoside kinase (ribokinase family)